MTLLSPISSAGPTAFPATPGWCLQGWPDRSRNRARQDHLIIDHGQAAKNIFAEAAGADGCGNGCDTDGVQWPPVCPR